MTAIEVSHHVEASPQRVWEELARLEDHDQWMADARSIEFLGESRRGVGTRMAVETRLGPLRTRDLMVVVEWTPPRVMRVSHHGWFQGEGAFTLVPTATGTTVVWHESLRFPWHLGGVVGGWLARPVLIRVWRANLRRFADRLS